MVKGSTFISIHLVPMSVNRLRSNKSLCIPGEKVPESLKDTKFTSDIQRTILS